MFESILLDCDWWVDSLVWRLFQLLAVPHVRNALKRAESLSSKAMESMYFKFSDKVVRSKVDKAHLWLYLNPVSAAQLAKNATVWIHIYKVMATFNIVYYVSPPFED